MHTVHNVHSVYYIHKIHSALYTCILHIGAIAYILRTLLIEID